MAAATGAYRTVLTHFSQRYPKIPAGMPATGATPPLRSRRLATHGNQP